MYSSLLFYHNLLRWIALLALVYACARAFSGYIHKKPFGIFDNKIRHWTATILHIQLLVGMILYFQSPVVRYFNNTLASSIKSLEHSFFGLLHPVLMLIAIIIITIGSAKSKRQVTSNAKFKTMLIWFSIGLLIILMIIPWPFSPLAARPYLR